MLTRRLRYQTKKIQLAKKIVLVAIGILCMLVLLWQYSSFNEDVLPVNANAGLQQEQSRKLQLPAWRDILFSGIPNLISATEPKLMIVKEEKSSSGQQILRETILFLTNVDIKDMRSLFQAEIPVLAAVKPVTQTVTALSLPNFPKFEITKDIPKGKPLVGLYYTHTAESFVPSSGVTHRPSGQRGDIVDVGEAFVKRLASYDVAVLQDRTINDAPSFMKAYGASEITVKKMLSENPSIQMIFDIHRDAEKRENTTIVINGVQIARIMFVVTTGQQGLAQPHWQSNHAFAKLIEAKLNQRYPGFSRGIRMDDWRYNQHLHPRALLVEIGCQENTKEEAERGMELFGDIVAEIIAENNKQ